MKDYIENRVLETANYIIETGCTIRCAAKKFGVSKSTTHKDVVERLPKIKPQLYKEIESILEYHTEIRHIRGGEATKEKYLYEKEQ